ncbi:hypothetical protein [Acidocella sp. KAb 2-4]|uniref:hypothetical protein n=1 Tax=Acidocella sp. KAb 2-4 TaxID=2885158 RepID=UPI001D078303|nr:hypothetical protein [Acidocella sp. KAb 2-4]
MAGSLAIPAPAAAAGYTTLLVMPSFFTAHNNNGSQIRAYELPLTLTYHAKNWRVSISAPLLAVTGPGVLSAGAIYAIPKAYGTRVGVGDIWLEGSVSLDRPARLRPEMSPYVLIKLPTDARSRGLGTGTTDYEAGTSLLWHWQHFYPIARAGYRVVHSSHGYRWRDTFLVSAGFSYSFGRVGFVTLEFERRGTGHHHQPPTETMFLAYTRPVNQRWSILAFGLHGFTFSSTDYGAGIGAAVRF